VLLPIAAVTAFGFPLEENLKYTNSDTLVASSFAAYLLLIVTSYILLSNPHVDPSWGATLLALSLVAVVIPSYITIKNAWKILSSMPVLLIPVILLLWLIFYSLTRAIMRTANKDGEALALLYSLGAVLFFTIVLEAGVAFAVLIIHLYVSRSIWRLASRARKKASGETLPELFK